MSTNYAIAPLVCAVFTGLLGYFVGRILESRAWGRVLSTLKDETAEGDAGSRDRNVLDRVRWRRAVDYP